MPQEPSPYTHLRTLPVPMQALVEAGLTPTQWIICYLLHFGLWNDYMAYATGENAPGGFSPEELDELHDRFYLIFEPRPGNHERLSPTNFRVSERFTDLLPLVGPVHRPSGVTPDVPLPPPQRAHNAGQETFVEQGVYAPRAETLAQPLELLDMYDELFDAYPSHIPVQGQLVSGRSGDQEQMAVNYAKALSGKKSMPHQQILALVEWAKQQSPSLITMGLQKFIASREWLGLQSLRDSGITGGTFDNAESI